MQANFVRMHLMVLVRQPRAALVDLDCPGMSTQIHMSKFALHVRAVVRAAACQ